MDETKLSFDVMSYRSGMMISLAAAVDVTRDEHAKHMLLMAMDSLLFTIDPPRGQLVEIKNDRHQ